MTVGRISIAIVIAVVSGAAFVAWNLQGAAVSGEAMMVRTLVSGILGACFFGGPWIVLRRRQAE